MKSLVVFHDHGAHWLDPILKPGFRHCFCAIAQGNYWIRVDGLAGLPLIDVASGSDYDLAEFYREQGFTVLELNSEGRPNLMPLTLTNCVGLIKSVLGIKGFGILTPYQLFKHLGGSNVTF